MAALGGYEGEAKRRNAQKIMDASWMRDAATKPVYVKWVDSGLPIIDDDDIPVYAKYNVKSYHNVTGDEVAYLLQFRLEDMRDNSNIRVGSYVQICNEMDEPEWWIITHLDDRTQFRQFSILKCLYVYRWVSRVDGKRRIYECLGAPRNQSSYNSGVWLDYTFQVPENQHIAVLPTNDDSRTLMYDNKLLVGDPLRYPPIAMKVSKIQSSLNGNITHFTMTQEQFNPATDNVEKMLADYWESAVEPVVQELEEIPTISDLEITYSGLPAVRAGGGYKKFRLQSRIDEKFVDTTDDVEWHVDFGGKEDKLMCSIQDNILKVKCTNDYSLIGSTFTITATTKYSSKSLIVEVTSL
jgi:hypothetical protein